LLYNVFSLQVDILSSDSTRCKLYYY